MDPNAGAIAGLVGGIVGSVVGIMGGVIGTYCSIRNTTRPRERTVAIRMVTTTWAYVGVFLLLGGVLLYIMPPFWGGLSALVSLPIVLGCLTQARAWNARLAEARAEDLKEASAAQG
jgi:hypothetical protein